MSTSNMDATDIVYISAEAVVGLCTVIGNSLVLAAIVRTRRLHTITNVFVGNLAIADIAVGVLVAPCAALSFKGLPENFYGCVFINCLILMFTNISILMLLSVAIERFIAIKEPFLYHRLLTVRRAIIVNVCVWILGSVLGLMPMYGWHGEYRIVTYCRFTDVVPYEYMVYFQFFGLVLLPLFFMFCIYIYILIIVRRHMRQTNALHNRFQQNNAPSDGFTKDVRAAKMFALVILIFAIFWFPVNIFNCVSLFCGSDCPFPKQSLLAAIVMSHANSSINPFLYATSNSRIKGAIKELFGIKLSPDERSSTDHNNARNVTNGASRARENVVSPTFHQDKSSNKKDDVPSNTISRGDFSPGIVDSPVVPKEQQHDRESGIIPNNITHSVRNNGTKHAVGNNGVKHVANVNNNAITPGFNALHHSRNHSSQSEVVSLSSLAVPDTGLPHNPPATHHPHSKRQLYSTTNDNHHSAFVQLSTTSSHSSLSDSHSCCDHDDIGHPNLAFVDADSSSLNDDRTNQISSICDKIDGSSVQTFSENHSKNTGFHDLWDSSDPDTIEPVIIYRQFSNGPYHSSRVSKSPQSSDPIQSMEVLMVKMFNGGGSPETTITSLTGHRSGSCEKLELCVNTEEDTRTEYKLPSETHTVHRGKNNSVFTSSIFVDEYGVLRNAKTEHTKL